MTAAQLNADIYQRTSDALANMDDLILVQESTETVFNHVARWRDIRRCLSRLPRESTLAVLSSLSVAVARGRTPLDAVLQFRVAESLSDGSRRFNSLVRRLRDGPPRILIYEEQLAVLTGFAISYANAPSWPADGNALLLEALLAFNSLHATEINDASDDPVTRLLLTEVRASITEVENRGEVLARYGTFIEWAQTPEARASRHFIDVDELFMQSTGMSYLDFAAAMMAFYTNFGGATVGVDGRLSYFPFLDGAKFLESVARPETLRSWLERVTIRFEDARARLRDTPESTTIASLQDFMATPLLIVGDGLYCPALRYLPNVAGNGLLFRLGAYLHEERGPEAANHLRGFFAKFLEDYVADLLATAAKRRGCQIFPEQPVGNTAVLSSDIAMFDHGDAIFIDVNSKRFNINRSVIALDLESITDDLDKMIVSKVKKIADRAADFRSGRLVYDGIDARSINRITGLVVTPQGLARFLGISRKLEELLPLVPAGLDQWDFFDLHEIELLTRVFDGELAIGELVATKNSDEPGRRQSLTNFMWRRMRDRLTDNRTAAEVLAEPWFKAVLAKVQSWGLQGGT